jgi:hypothetical protein
MNLLIVDDGRVPGLDNFILERVPGCFVLLTAFARRVVLYL